MLADRPPPRVALLLQKRKRPGAREGQVAKLRERGETSGGRAASPAASAEPDQGSGNFRFFDNRQKYLLFVNTCSEKWVIAERAALWSRGMWSPRALFRT